MKKIIFGLLTVLIFALSSCVPTSVSDDIINPDSDFLYFYGKDCPHCQELNRELESLGMYSLVSIEKRETYYNNDNRLMFLAATEALWLESSKVGVPFVLDRRTREHAIWVQPALALLATRIGEREEIDFWTEDEIVEDNSDEIQWDEKIITE